MLFHRLGTGEQLFHRRLIKRLEHQHTRARQQRRDQLERRVLGRRADQHDGAVFHDWQKGILLGAVEAVNLVDEEQGPLPDLAPGPRRVEHFFQIGDAGKDRRNLLEIKFGRVRKEPRHRGLAGTGRPPEYERAERARLQHPGERAVRPKQMILPDHLGKRLRAQLVGQRPRRIALEAGSGEECRRFGPWTARHKPNLVIVMPGLVPRLSGLIFVDVAHGMDSSVF